MARIFMDGFESGKPTYANSTVYSSAIYNGGLWLCYSATTAASLGASTTTRNTYSGYSFRYLMGGATTAYATSTFASTYTSLYTRFYIRKVTDTGSNNVYISLIGGGTVRCSLRVGGSGQVIGIANSSLVFTSSNGVIDVGTQWYKVEFFFKANASTGELTCYVDNVNIGSWTGDSGTTAVDSIRIGGVNTSNFTSSDFYIDDLAVNDTTGSINNSWCGDGTIIGLVPKGAGNYMQMSNVGAAVSNWQAVDEIPNDGDTSYVHSNVVGTMDTYDMQELVATKSVPSNATVNASQILYTARYSDASGSVAPVLRSGSTDYIGTNVAATSVYTGQIKYQVFDISPFTSSQWTVSEIDGIEAGIKFQG